MIVVPKEVCDLIERLEQGGYEAYVVGGCVRDALLGRSPQDWDLCTSARPEQTAACFEKEDLSLAGFRHGTVAVIQDGKLYEITSYRLEGPYHDNRHPDWVEFIPGLKKDLSRRDFTVNAMAYHPKKGMVDFWNGQEDLKNGVLRAVGDPVRRFSEDALRILRGMRFAAVYGFSVEPETAAAALFCREKLAGIASERVGQELSRLLMGRYADRAIEDFWPVIETVFPGAGEEGLRQAAWALKKAPVNLIVRLAALLSFCPMTVEKDLIRLSIGKKMMAQVFRLLSHKDVPLPISREQAAFLLRDLGEDLAIRWLEMRLALGEGPSHYKKARALLEDTARTGCYTLDRMAVNGRDLMKMGFSGPDVGMCLNHLLEKVIREEIPNRRQALLSAAEDWKKHLIS